MLTPLPAAVTCMQDPETRGNPREVYVWLHQRLDVQHFRAVKVDEVSFSMRLSRSAAGEALLTLVRLGYLDRAPLDRRAYTYRLFHSNPAREMAALAAIVR